MNQQPLKQYAGDRWWEWDGRRWVPEPPPQESTWPTGAKVFVGILGTLGFVAAVVMLYYSAAGALIGWR